MKLKKQQIEGLVLAIYHELNAIFYPSEESEFFRLQDETRKKRILRDLKHILENQFKTNIEDKSVFKIFEETESS